MHPPTSELLASVGVWHWIDHTAIGHVAFLLIAHPSARVSDTGQMIEARMRGLADALALAEPAAVLPDIGPRLFMSAESEVVLRLDGCQYAMRARAEEGWRRFVNDGGTVAVAVGLDPLPTRAPRELVERYVVDRVTEGRLLLGKARAERRMSQKPGSAPL